MLSIKPHLISPLLSTGFRGETIVRLSPASNISESFCAPFCTAPFQYRAVPTSWSMNCAMQKKKKKKGEWVLPGDLSAALKINGYVQLLSTYPNFGTNCFYFWPNEALAPKLAHVFFCSIRHKHTKINHLSIAQPCYSLVHRWFSQVLRF